jgi:hypothetical protein
MSLVRGGEYETVDMQVSAAATGNGTAATPFSVTRGSYNLLTAQVTGISGDTITWEGTIDETNWAAIPAYKLATQSISSTATADGIYRLAVTGLRGVRARISTWASGTINVKGILSSTGELGASGGGSGVSDHALLSNLDFASAGHTGFEAEGTAAAAITTHVGLSDPHTQYALESSLGSAALLNVGTSANNVVQLDGTGKLPAVDGSQLTGISGGGGGTPGGSTTQVQYNNAGAFAGDAGMTYNAANDRLTVAGGLIAGDWSPPSDSTTAVSVWNAARTTRILTVDTTNAALSIVSQSVNNRGLSIYQNNSGVQAGVASFLKSRGTSASPTTAANGDLIGVFSGRAYDGSNYLSDVSLFGFHVTGTVGTNSAPTSISFCVGSAPGNYVPNLLVHHSGYVGIGLGGTIITSVTAPTALLDIAASTTNRASLRIREGARPTTPNTGDAWNDGAIGSYQINATTNAVVNSLKLERASSGTPAAGFGLGIAARLESSTTEDQDAGRLTYEWVTATHASRASRGKLSAYYTSTEQTAMTWDGDTGGLKLGFYGVTPVARQVLATGAGRTVDDVITALQNLGLVKQS